MKQWKKVGICVIPVVLVIALGLTVWQWENFKTVCTVLLDDSKAISRKMGETQHKQQENLGEAYHITVLPPSIAQSNALLNGKTSPEEVKDSLGISQVMQTIPEQEEGGTDSPQPAQTQQPAKPKLEPTKTSERSDTELPEAPEEVQTEEPELTEEERKNQIETLVNQCVAELYACEVDLMAVLGEMKQAASDEWYGLKPKEQTKEKKMEIGFAGLDKCYELEVQVDEQVTGILERYRGPLEALKADMTVLEELWRYYCDKKASQKAYYLEKYLD